MSLSIGIVGLPNVGKSTLFNALTGSNILAANYPFATIEPNTGVVPVPDERLTKLADLYTTGPSHLDGAHGNGEQRTEPYTEYGEGAAQSVTQRSAKSTSRVAGSAGQQAGAMQQPRIVPATVTFVDIAGLVAGASSGEGLGNQFLSHIRSTNAIVQVVRAFDDTNVTHVDEAHDPKKDIDVINTELVLADLQTLSKRLPRLEKEARADPKLKPMLSTYQQVNTFLNDGDPVWNHSEIDQEQIADLQLLTAKPIIYLFNLDESGLSDTKKQDELQKMVAPAQALFVCAKLESELKDLDETDAAELLESYGQQVSGLLQLIHAAYETLNLQSFLTAGEKEVRAWTIPKGATAPQAAGAIHGDFERGFIAADIVSSADLLAAGSLAAARNGGKVRTEGKTYVMQADDVAEFKFNVSK